MSRPTQHIPAGAVQTSTGWVTAAGERYLTRVELAKKLGYTSADLRRWSCVYGPGRREPLWPDHDPAVGLADGGQRYLPVSAARAWLRARAVRTATVRRENLAAARAARGAGWVQK